MFFLLTCFQSQEDGDKKEGCYCICCFSWKISECGNFRVSCYMSNWSVCKGSLPIANFATEWVELLIHIMQAFFPNEHNMGELS